MKPAKYALLFVIFSFVGYLLDTGYRSLVEGTFTQGTLFPGIAPIYGFGGVFLVLLFSTWKVNTYLQVAVGTIGVTLIELLGGLFTTHILGVRLWDYSNNFLNFLGHIDALHFLFWLILVIIFRFAIFEKMYDSFKL